MSNQRHLFICDTPFQIMMALAFRMNTLKDETVDIIISDIINDSFSLYENIKKSNIFSNVYYLKNYHIDYEVEIRTKYQDLFQTLFRKHFIKQIFKINNSYNFLYVTDSLKSFNWIYEILLKKNPEMKLFYYEEGPVSVLCDQGNHFKKYNEYGGRKYKLKNKLLGIKPINGNFSGAYVSVKSLMKETYFPWIDIPKITNEQLKKYVDVLNSFWNYKSTNDFKNKIIYLEESFFTDKHENHDMEIIDDLINNYGTEKIIVKLHPRTRINRFEPLGIKTYNKFSVPWELIVLNNDLDNSILICYASGSIIHPALYWGIQQKSIALVNCKEYHFSYLNNDYYKMYSYLCEQKKLSFLPNNKKEFLCFISDALGNKK